MDEYYRFVVSIPCMGARISYAFWASYKKTEEEGRKWAEQQPWLKDKAYTISSKLMDDAECQHAFYESPSLRP